MPSFSLIERTGSSGRGSTVSHRREASHDSLQRVADAVHGADQVRAELAAQRLDVAVHGPGARRVRPAPHLGEQPLAGQHRARPAGEVHQQVELGGRQVHLRAGAAYPALAPVDLAGRRAPACGAGSAAACRPARPGAAGRAPGRPAPASRTAWSGSRRPRPPSPTSTSVSSSRAVSMSTGTGRSAWMRRHTSRPSKPGSMTSRTTRSGRWSGRRGHGGRPVAARSTAKPSARSRAATDSAMVRSSSTTRIRRRPSTPWHCIGRS